MARTELFDPYIRSPNFSTLARDVPAFAPHVQASASGPTIDFKDPKALRALASALLERDFKLKMSLPEDRLCPMVPGRHEYVLWILAIALTGVGKPTASSPLTGVDIGTGASAIYPLLCCSTLRKAVRVVGTDIDDHSIDSARLNVSQNNMVDRIVLVKSNPFGPLFPEEALAASPTIDLTMCNPPFYSSEEEIQSSLALKELEPAGACTGGSNEMITPGGEVAFVSKMVLESLTLKTKIRWFSSLLGKHSSVAHIVDLLHQHKIDNYALKELQQGQTKRFLIAWSFGTIRLPDSLSRPSSTINLTKFLPQSSLHSYYLPSTFSLSSSQQVLSELLTDLVISHSWSPANLISPVCQFRSETKTWSRAARRKKKNPDGISVEDPCAIEGTLTLVVVNEGKQVRIEGEWTRGDDRPAFVGLWGYLIRKMAAAAGPVEISDRVVGMDLSS